MTCQCDYLDQTCMNQESIDISSQLVLFSQSFELKNLKLNLKNRKIGNTTIRYRRVGMS